MKRRKKRRTDNISLIITIIITIISLLLIKFYYISLSFSTILIIYTLINRYKYKSPILIITLINIIIIILNLINIYSIYITNNQDIYINENILLGSWLYNKEGGTYLFKENNIYIQYSNSNTKDNYCQGTYKYKYGASKKNEISIKQDKNYYYYTLTLEEDYCMIMNKKFYDDYTKTMYFGIYKNDKNKITIINKENNNLFEMTKNKE